MIKKILILGSNSFAGSTFANFCLKKKIKVHGVSRSKLSDNFNLLNKKLKKKFSFFRYDLNKDRKKIISLIKRNKYEYIVDFMGQGMVAESWLYPNHWIDTNIKNKTLLINEIKNFKFLKKYIRISTPEVYGSNKFKIKENFICNPTTPYAISHMAIDFMLLAFYKTFNFPAIILRFSNFYGPGQQLYRIIPLTILKILKKEKLQLHGSGKSLRSFIFSDDFSKAIFCSMKKGNVGEIYNISSNDILSISEVVRKISEIMRYDYKKLVVNVKDRKSKDFKYLMDSGKAKRKLKWSNLTTFDDGLSKTIIWYKNYFNILKFKNNRYIHKK